MGNKEPNSASLIISLVTLILGIILAVNGDNILSIARYILSGLLIVSGIIKFIITYFSGKKYNNTDISSLIFSLACVGLGIVLLIFSNVIEFTISLCLGALIIFSGVQRLILGFAIRKLDEKGSKFYIIESLLIILLGIVILINKFFNLIGLFLIIYAISELVGYIYYTTQDKDYSEVLNKKVTKEMKESKAIEAVIIEDNTNLLDDKTDKEEDDKTDKEEDDKTDE